MSDHIRDIVEDTDAGETVETVETVEDFELDVLDPNLTLQTVYKTKSKSEVWKYFGCVQKCGKAVTKLSHKIFCKLCFADKKLKGYVKYVLVNSGNRLNT